ncbi:PAS domain-containing protein [Methylocapsa aurea]|uniref:PAS domain-containing protein n=1 Tax=Methylocapsa aurea TaxID=663610 RepID=UPI00138E0013|nr:PAS domain-containing protein [Methylocapsa aurea]
MRQKGTRDLFAYWNGLRRGRAAPERAEIDPAAIRHVLADTFMLEADRAEKFPFRLSGTRVNALFDAELKGRSFIDLWRPKEAQNMPALLLNVIDSACPIFARIAAGPEGYGLTELELLLLPIHHHGKAQARILGHIACPDQPSWLGLLPAQHLVLRALRVVRDEAATDPSMIQSRRAEPPISWAANSWAASSWAAKTHLFVQRGHLRIYPGGRRDEPIAT